MVSICRFLSVLFLFRSVKAADCSELPRRRRKLWLLNCSLVRSALTQGASSHHAFSLRTSSSSSCHKTKKGHAGYKGIYREKLTGVKSLGILKRWRISSGVLHCLMYSATVLHVKSRRSFTSKKLAACKMDRWGVRHIFHKSSQKSCNHKKLMLVFCSDSFVNFEMRPESGWTGPHPLLQHISCPMHLCPLVRFLSCRTRDAWSNIQSPSPKFSNCSSCSNLSTHKTQNELVLQVNLSISGTGSGCSSPSDGSGRSEIC